MADGRVGGGCGAFGVVLLLLLFLLLPAGARLNALGAGRCQFAMGLKTIWKDYKVVIVMGAGLGLVHWGWFYIKSSPIFQMKTENFVPEPGIVTYMMQSDQKNKEK